MDMAGFLEETSRKMAIRAPRREIGRGAGETV
jgi:hypothetical protein